MVTKCLSRFNRTIKKQAAANRTAYNSEYMHVTYVYVSSYTLLLLLNNPETNEPLTEIVKVKDIT
jgi:hypothetical protein